jgi:mRNA interferase RelE/StbE
VSLVWTIEWDDFAKKQLRKLDRPVQKKILDYLDEKIVQNPQSFGRELLGNKAGLWRYRIEDYRVICRIENQKLVILVRNLRVRLKRVYDFNFSTCSFDNPVISMISLIDLPAFIMFLATPSKADAFPLASPFAVPLLTRSAVC